MNEDLKKGIWRLKSAKVLSFTEARNLGKSAKASGKKALKPTEPISSEQQTDTVSNELVNTKHLAAKEPDISLRHWWRPKTEQKW